MLSHLGPPLAWVPRMMMRKLGLSAAIGMLSVLSLAATACEGDESGESSEESDFTSAEATLLTFEFDGELVTTDTWDIDQTIQDQLLYTIGHLNGNRSVGRLDTVQITDVASERLDDGSTKVTYHAVLPVGWGSKTNLPTKYDFKLPKHIDSAKLGTFTEKYSHSCVDAGAHDVDSGSYWYYYRPARSGCSLADADIVKTTATVTKSAENTEGKYPEYDMVWADDRLDVVAIFGKYEDGATTSSDAGVSAYGRFVNEARKKVKNLVVTPASAPATPGVADPIVTIEGDDGDGHAIKITAMMTDSIASAPRSFFDKYDDLSASADLIFYNGHAGLGQNVRALAQKGKFVSGKYQIFFMNGCDTFAYVDGSLAKTRSVLNPDDPTGTKYMDMVTNVMPSFFHSMPAASMAMINGLLSVDAPKTYQEIFANIDRSEVVVVTGEEDNVYDPNGSEEPAWELNDKGVVTPDQQIEYDLGELPAGTYEIAIHEDQAAPGGDADLYVRTGSKPTLTSYDQRPWLDGSNETVTITLTAKTRVYAMVHGYESMSTDSAAFSISGRVAP
jgi:hypothetical protein